MPFAKPDAEPVYLAQMKAVLKRHPKTSIIWAHIGLGRIVHPVQVSAAAAERSPTQLAIVEAMLTDPAFNHVNFDISWDEVAKYAVATPESIARVAAALNKYPDRFLFGTDTVAPAGPAPYLRGLRHLGAGLAPADPRGEPQGPQGQLRADLRRGKTKGPRLGKDPAMKRSIVLAVCPVHRSDPRLRSRQDGLRWRHGGRWQLRRRRRPPTDRASRSTASRCSTSATTSSRSTRTGSTRCASPSCRRSRGSSARTTTPSPACGRAVSACARRRRPRWAT